MEPEIVSSVDTVLSEEKMLKTIFQTFYKTFSLTTMAHLKYFVESVLQRRHSAIGLGDRLGVIQKCLIHFDGPLIEFPLRLDRSTRPIRSAESILEYGAIGVNLEAQ